MFKKLMSIMLAFVMTASIMVTANVDGTKAEAMTGADSSTLLDLGFSNKGMMSAVFTYKQNANGTLTITGSKDVKATELCIPEKIGGKTVRYIADNAFANYQRLKRVWIPETVENVGDGCFLNCPNLDEIDVLNPYCYFFNDDYSYGDLLGCKLYSYKDANSFGFANSTGCTFVAIDMPIKPQVTYRTHVQSYGWESKWAESGQLSGTEGLGKRLEAIQIKLVNQPVSGDIAYGTYVQTYGWGKGSFNGEISGTQGEGKRLEAIWITLNGDMSKYYEVYYRVHAQSYGWLGLAHNAERAGTAGFAKRLEAIEITVALKGCYFSDMSEYDDDPAFIDGTRHCIMYSTHVQSHGWQMPVMDGEVSGTVGEGKRLEGIKLVMYDVAGADTVEYRTHVQTYGWEQTWKREGELSGTVGEGKRLEAIQIRLKGSISNSCDIYYRVHAQSFGWLGWAKNGAPAGTEGYGKRLEAIEIVVIRKGALPPGSTANAFIKK